MTWFSWMAAMLHDVVVIERTRSSSMPLAMLTIKNSCMASYFHAYMWLCFYNYGAPLGGPSSAMF